MESSAHIKNLWKIREQAREDLRDRHLQLDFRITNKQWINDLPAILKAKLWNNDPQIKITNLTISNYIASCTLLNATLILLMMKRHLINYTQKQTYAITLFLHRRLGWELGQGRHKQPG